jgi:hypothetical protein
MISCKKIPLIILCAVCGFAPMAMAAGDPSSGAGLYADNCSVCHGTRPKAAFLDDVNGDPANIVTCIQTVPEMSGFKGLTAAQIADIAAYLAQVQSGGGAPPPSYQGLWWKSDEAGWGVNFAHQGDRIFATWYTYDTAGNAYWLTMLATATVAGGNTFKGDINVSTGPAFNNFTGNVPPATKVGDGTITFSDANTGTFAYNLNAGTGGATSAISQVKPITRFVLDASSAQPVCSYQATPDLNAATNYQDLWWLPSESGWGANFAHQGNAIYATWYTYDAKVAGNNAPLWLSAYLTRQGGTNVFNGDMYRTSGARFDNFKASDVVQPATKVGTATLSFADGNHGTFHYVTNGSGNLPAVDQTKQITRLLFAPPAATVCQ